MLIIEVVISKPQQKIINDMMRFLEYLAAIMLNIS